MCGEVADGVGVGGLGGYGKADEDARLFEELGVSKDQVMNLLEDRFMMDPDAVKLPLSAYGKQTQRLNKNGGVVPIKKAKKGMKIKKRYGR